VDKDLRGLLDEFGILPFEVKGREGANFIVREHLESLGFFNGIREKEST
jgi:hypothetical protein